MLAPEQFTLLSYVGRFNRSFSSLLSTMPLRRSVTVATLKRFILQRIAQIDEEVDEIDKKIKSMKQLRELLTNGQAVRDIIQRGIEVFIRQSSSCFIPQSIEWNDVMGLVTAMIEVQIEEDSEKCIKLMEEGAKHMAEYTELFG